MSVCNCPVCQRHREWKKIIASRDPDRLIALVHELAETLEAVETDYEVCQAIFAGTWVSARAQLTAALERCPADA